MRVKIIFARNGESSGVRLLSESPDEDRLLREVYETKLAATTIYSFEAEASAGLTGWAMDIIPGPRPSVDVGCGPN